MIILFLDADAFEKIRKIAELPIADWVYQVSEGTPDYVIFPKSRTELPLSNTLI